MRCVTFGSRRLRAAAMPALLAASVLLAGCASKSAPDQSARYQNDRSRVTYRARLPQRLVRPRRQDLGRATPPQSAALGPAVALTAGAPDDAARYAAVYGVTPPPTFEDDIARRNAVALLRPSRAFVDQAPVARPIQASYERRIVVTGGDTLYSIAGRYRTSVAALLVANGLRSTNIAIGQELIVPARR